MQKKILVTLLALCMLLAVLPFALTAGAATSVSDCEHVFAADATACSGCGAIAIGTADELIKLMNQQDGYSWSANYVLTADIDLSKKTDTTADLNQTPIGTENDIYSGTFDGNSKTVSGVEISDSTNYTGFFGRVATGTVIEDLTISGSVMGTGYYVGGLVGYSANDFTIRNCINECAVTGSTGSKYVGGVIGYANTNKTCTVLIENCRNTAQVDNTATTVTTGLGAGGIIGAFNYNDTDKAATINISKCSNEGDVKGVQDVGGIGGYLYFSKAPVSKVQISECWNSGAIVATSKYAGGIVGLHFYLDVINCLNTGKVTDAAGTPGGISARINGKTVAKSIKYCYNANGTMGVVGQETSSGKTNAVISGAYYKAAGGVSDSFGGSEYDYETHFATLNTESKWVGTTNPKLVYFHEHDYTNGPCTCGLSKCDHKSALAASISVDESGKLIYVCDTCKATVYTVENPWTEIYVSNTDGKVLTTDVVTTIGTAETPFADFSVAMQYAAIAAANEDTSAKVHIVDDAYVPASYASPEYAGVITITGKTSEVDTDKGTLHFDATADRRYYANGDITFENLIFASTTVGTASSGGARFFAQNHKWVMDKGVEMANAGDGIVDNGYGTTSDFKLYLYGGFEFETGDSSPVMDTNLTVRSGDYWAITGWNYNYSSAAANTSKCVASQGTGTMTLGKANTDDRLFVRYWIGFSSNIQPLSADSKVTMIIDGELAVHSFYYGTQHNPDAKESTLFETDLVLKSDMKLNSAASNTINGETVGIIDITGATNTTTKLNVYVDERATAEATAALALFVGENKDSAIATMGTEVTNSTYVDYCATYMDGAHAADAAIHNEDTCPACEVCGAVIHKLSNPNWVTNTEGGYKIVCDCDTVLATTDNSVPYVYLAQTTGSDTWAGATAKSAVKTIEEAVNRIKDFGGIIYLVEDYTVTEDITLPEYTKAITITTASAETPVIGFNTQAAKTLNLNGPTVIDGLAFGGSETLYVAANWNDLKFGDNVSASAAKSIYVILGGNDAAPDHSETKHVSLRLGKAAGDVTLFGTVILGDRTTKNISHTVSNKTIDATFENASIKYLYASTTGNNANSGNMQNYHVNVDMTGTTVVEDVRVGNYNTTRGGAYIDSLTLNMQDQAKITKQAIVRNVHDAKINLVGTNRTVDDAFTTDLQLMTADTYSSEVIYDGTNDTAVITYTSHTFADDKDLKYKDFTGSYVDSAFDGELIVRYKNECTEFTALDTPVYTVDGELKTCTTCGKQQAVATDGIYVWPEVVSTDSETGTVTVDLYAKSTIEFWGVEFKVAAEGYTLTGVTAVMQEAAEDATGVTGFAFNYGTEIKENMAIWMLPKDDKLQSKLAETKVATLTFAKDEGTTADAEVVVSITDACAATDTDTASLTAQAYALAAVASPYERDTTTTYGGGVVLDSEYIVEYTVTATEAITVNNAYMVFEVTDANGYVAKATVYPYEAGGKLRFQAPGIAAKNMGDEITGTLYYTDTEGTLHKAQTKSFNLESYYTGVMNSSTFEAEEYNDLKALLKTMFNYGTAAQKYFDYDTTNLSNSILNSADRVDYTEKDVTANKATSSIGCTNPTYRAVSANVGLEQRILFGLKFKLVGDAHLDLTTLTFQGSYTDVKGNTKSFTIAGDKMTINEDNQLCFDIDQIAAKDLNQEITGALYSGNTQVSANITFNLECYVTTVVNGSYSAEHKAVSRAVLDYSLAAATWLGK